MSAVVACARCGRSQAPALTEKVHPGALGDEIQQRVCQNCWTEWRQMEVMVINELRLNFMDPQAQEVLTGHLREFLCLDSDA
jgi:Fe-S cluster biosynthesis and repair protein YggX